LENGFSGGEADTGTNTAKGDLAQRGVAEDDVKFIEKPFVLDVFAGKVREVPDG
jgi:hypothetical protein